jgi:hypothetical protein
VWRSAAPISSATPSRAWRITSRVAGAWSLMSGKRS